MVKRHRWQQDLDILKENNSNSTESLTYLPMRGRNGLFFIHLMLTPMGSYLLLHLQQVLSDHALNERRNECCAAQGKRLGTMAHIHNTMNSGGTLASWGHLIIFSHSYSFSSSPASNPNNYAVWLNTTQNIFSIRGENRNLPLVCLYSVACQPSANISILGLRLLLTFLL